MERVDGIGGFFFRAKNPDELIKWYEANLGILPVPTGAGQEPWHQAAGPTAFSPFPADTEYFGSPSNGWMLNLRVLRLDAMVAQLRAAGIAVEVIAGDETYGRFARLQDPEGHPIELWQPSPA